MGGKNMNDNEKELIEQTKSNKLKFPSLFDNKEKVLLGLSCLFGGMVLGFLIAPIKKGIYCGNYNGNNSANKYGKPKNLDFNNNEI